ncbi:hypothetical protein [Streptomyces sp. NPDC127072]|uniref:hypothetical protein n=1 Tax=Streptomyces sp. NPDC127072 TaxID=3347129 RepID=UPI00366A4543
MPDGVDAGRGRLGKGLTPDEVVAGRGCRRTGPLTYGPSTYEPLTYEPLTYGPSTYQPLAYGSECRGR